MTVHHYRAMLAQRQRMEAFRAAITAAVRPGDRVLVRAQRNLEVVAPFAGSSDELYGIDWESSRDYAANTPLRLPIAPEEVIGPPRLLVDVSLLPPPTADAMSGEASWTFSEPAEVHGLAYWFELEVGDTWLSNAPGEEPGSWGHLLLPADRAMTHRSPHLLSPGRRRRARAGPLGRISLGRGNRTYIGDGGLRRDPHAGGAARSTHAVGTRTVMDSGNDRATRPDDAGDETESRRAFLVRIARGVTYTAPVIYTRSRRLPQRRPRPPGRR